jgi:putative endonuclease
MSGARRDAPLAGGRETGGGREQGDMGADAEAWVYMLRCRDGTLYTGWTIDLDRRLARHRAGTASRYTASRLPVTLAFAQSMADRTAARREEVRIKRLPRKAKLALVVDEPDLPAQAA